MLDQDRILTLHPQGKKGVNILKEKYDFIKDFILSTIEESEEQNLEITSNIEHSLTAPTQDNYKEKLRSSSRLLSKQTCMFQP